MYFFQVRQISAKSNRPQPFPKNEVQVPPEVVYAVATPVKSEAEIPAGTRQLARTPIKPPTLDQDHSPAIGDVQLMAQPAEDSGATPETGFALRQAPILKRYLAIISG